MYGQAGARVQLFVTYVTFEMFGFLMVDEDLLVVKVSVAVPLSDGIKVRNQSQAGLKKQLEFSLLILKLNTKIMNPAKTNIRNRSPGYYPVVHPHKSQNFLHWTRLVLIF